MSSLENVGIAALVGVGFIAGTALLPATLGFGTSGIIAGSVAAGIQSAIGNVAAGSTFAICTSLGMKGVFATTAKLGYAGFFGIMAYIQGKIKSKK